MHGYKFVNVAYLYLNYILNYVFILLCSLDTSLRYIILEILTALYGIQRWVTAGWTRRYTSAFQKK